VFSADRREYTNLMKHLKASYALLDEEFKIFKIQESFSDESIVYYCFKLIIGIFSAILSFTWVLHIVIYFVVPKQGLTNLDNGKSPAEFLNVGLIWFQEHHLAFISTGIYSILCTYLLICVVKGCLKFGTRFLCCIEVHPLVKNETYIGSIIFNVNLVLIASISVTHFCLNAFKEYASMTDIEIIFGAQIRYLRFFKFFYGYQIFEFTLLGLTLAAFILLLMRPNDINSVKAKLEKVKKEDTLLDDSKTAIDGVMGGIAINSVIG
jgi:LMBR1 domain-containing protein 1